MKLLNGYGGITVELTESSKQSLATWEKDVFDMAKTTWASYDGVEYDPTVPEHREMVWGAFEGRVLPTVLEQINLKFIVKGMSRTCSHQFVRGRVGWTYNQQSQMPDPVTRDVSFPAHAYARPELREQLEAHVAEAKRLYDLMIDLGLPPQTARYVLPEGSNTDIYCQVTFPAFKGFVANRTCFSTNDEINFVARMMRNALLEVEPRWAKYLQQPCDVKQSCTLVDDVFPCCGKHPWPNPHKPKYGNKQNNSLIEMARRPDLMMHRTDIEAATSMAKIHARDAVNGKYDETLYGGQS